MGDPKRQRRKYSRPSHPWRAERIEEERVLMNGYGLKNKGEIWKIKSLLKKFSNHVKRLIASSEEQANIEKLHLLNKLKSLKLIDNSAHLEDILNIKVNNIMDRRLQTLVFKKGLTRSISQARQAIIHRHIIVGDKKVTSPGYLVSGEEEPKIAFSSKSPFSNPEHPERAPKEKKPGKKSKLVGKEDEKK